MELKPVDVYTTRGQIISELKKCIANPRKSILLYKEDFIRIIEELEKTQKEKVDIGYTIILKMMTIVMRMLDAQNVTLCL